MLLKQRKRIINKYYGGKVVPDLQDGWDIVNPQNHPSYLTIPGQQYPTRQWGDSVLQLPVLQPTQPMINLSVNDAYSSAKEYKPSVDIYTKTQHRSNVDAAGILVNGTNFVGDVINDFNSYKKSDEMIGDAGYRQSTINGVAYLQQNDINQRQLYDELDTINTANTVKTMGSGASLGGSIGGIFGPVGGLIGTIGGGLVGGIVGLFSGAHNKNKLRKQIYNGQQLIARTNRYNRSSAFSTGLERDYYNDNINTSGGVLHANKGKDLKQPRYGKN